MLFTKKSEIIAVKTCSLFVKPKVRKDNLNSKDNMFPAVIKPWIVSLRLRTLPLSASCIIMGSFLAAYKGNFDFVVLILALVTTLLLQILSNLSNEYGDMVKGTDSAGRVGPERSIQRGEITLPQMKNGILLTAIITSVTGTALVIYATEVFYTLIFILAGIAAIIAAVKYTVGEKPYGYRAMGDLFVFIFFGPVGVTGTFFLHSGFISADIFLPSMTSGLISVAVLNLNNMRDTENDLKHGKITLAILLGNKESRLYHLLIISVAITASVIFAALNSFSAVKYIYLVTFIPLIMSLFKVLKYTDPSSLDPELKKTAVSNLLHTIVFGIVLLI